MRTTVMDPLAAQLETVADIIQGAKRIAFINPEGGDGDSFGASLALANFVAQMGKAYTVVSLGANGKYAFLPRYQEVVRENVRAALDGCDVMITVDFAQLAMSGIEKEITEQRKRGAVLVNIDHHRTNACFGDVDVVDGECAAAAELVYRLFCAKGWRIDAGIATCLLTGLLYDTGMFAHRNTTDRTFAVAAELLRAGARMRLIIDGAYRNKSLNALRLWGVALSRLSPDAATGIVSTYVTMEDFCACGVDESAAEGIANFLNMLGEGTAVMVLRELPDGKMKGSLRTTNDEIDVSEIARRFGGGGHRRAAGFLYEGSVAMIQSMAVGGKI